MAIYHKNNNLNYMLQHCSYANNKKIYINKLKIFFKRKKINIKYKL